MKVTKKQIIDGVAMFIENCLIPSVSDGQIILVLCMVKANLKKNSILVDSFLDNTMVSSVITESEGMYDISTFVKVMKDILEDNDFPIIIPSVPLISPQKSVMHLTESQFDKLVSYIVPDDNDDE